MKRVVAFDIGQRNFAFVIVQIPSLTFFQKESEFLQIDGMYLFDLIGSEVSFCQKKWLTVCHSLYSVLDQFSQEWEHTDLILIEQQFTKRHRSNIQACKLGQHVLAYFLLRFGFDSKGPRKIIEFPSYHKTQSFDKSFSKKYDRKKWSVEYVSSFLSSHDHHPRHDHENHDENDDDDDNTNTFLSDWFSSFKKKDDVADCLLMILSYLQNSCSKEKKNDLNN